MNRRLLRPRGTPAGSQARHSNHLSALLGTPRPASRCAWQDGGATRTCVERPLITLGPGGPVLRPAKACAPKLNPTDDCSPGHHGLPPAGKWAGQPERGRPPSAIFRQKKKESSAFRYDSRPRGHDAPVSRPFAAAAAGSRQGPGRRMNPRAAEGGNVERQFSRSRGTCSGRDSASGATDRRSANRGSRVLGFGRTRMASGWVQRLSPPAWNASTGQGYQPPAHSSILRSALDRWLISGLNRCLAVARTEPGSPPEFEHCPAAWPFQPRLRGVPESDFAVSPTIGFEHAG